MLALEPTAQIFSSAGVNPGVPEIGPFAVGEFELDNFVSQDVVLDFVRNDYHGTLIHDVERFTTSTQLKSRKLPRRAPRPPWSMWDDNFDQKFLQIDPSDSAKFQILRKLHIAYPASLDNANKVAGSGRLPLVVVLHGQHAWWDAATKQHVPNYRGYIYLQRELASWGIVSVSVDTNVANSYTDSSLIEMRAESVLKTLDALWTLNDSVTTSPLYQRLDFDNIGLMGHSRGGDAVVRASIINNDSATRTSAKIDRGYGIQAVCSVAPTDFTGIATSGKSSLKSSQAPFYTVLYGALDGDVSGVDEVNGECGTGFRHYDRADTEKAMVFFERCNHNWFNDVWTFNDTYTAQNGRVISETQHRILAREYIGGLFRSRLLGTLNSLSLLDGTAANSVGEKCAIQWSFGRVNKLDDMESTTPQVGVRALPGGSIRNTMGFEALTSVDIYTNHQTVVLVTKANSSPTPLQTYTLTLPSPQDWTIYDQFVFRVCADADVSVETNLPGSLLPNFTLAITDNANSTARVAAARLSTADRPRRPVFHQALRETSSGLLEVGNCTVIHLETLAVDLSSVGGVDLTRITAIALEVPANFGARQFFDSFELVKR